MKLLILQFKVWIIYLECKIYTLKSEFYRLKCRFKILKCKFCRLKCKKKNKKKTWSLYAELICFRSLCIDEKKVHICTYFALSHVFIILCVCFQILAKYIYLFFCIIIQYHFIARICFDRNSHWLVSAKAYPPLYSHFAI